MTAEAKALLDELMGRSRNLDPSEQPEELSWFSDDVCKHFLCGFCPHELFTNTRADLGTCNKIHDDAFRKEYEKSPKFEKCGYEEEFLRFLNQLVNDVEKRIRRGHQRLALNSQPTTMNGSTGNQNEDKIKLLTERINELVVQAEELGCEGKVEEAQGVMKLADQLKEERSQLENPSADDEVPVMKQMEVCEVCGAFLIVGDAPQRQDEHLMGKQHAGYARVRSEIERRKMKTKQESEEREAREARLKAEREEREKERQRERDERRKKERDREKEREKERERRRRSRSRDRKRSRSRDRHRRRSSSRDRRRGGRSKSRERDRDRRRRSRSSSRSRRSSRRSSSRDRRSNRRRSRERVRSRDRKSSSKDNKEHSKSSGNKDRSSRDRDRSSKDDRDKKSQDRDRKKRSEEREKTVEDKEDNKAEANQAENGGGRQGEETNAFENHIAQDAEMPAHDERNPDEPPNAAVSDGGDLTVENKMEMEDIVPPSFEKSEVVGEGSSITEAVIQIWPVIDR